MSERPPPPEFEDVFRDALDPFPPLPPLPPLTLAQLRAHARRVPRGAPPQHWACYGTFSREPLSGEHGRKLLRWGPPSPFRPKLALLWPVTPDVDSLGDPRTAFLTELRIGTERQVLGELPQSYFLPPSNGRDPVAFLREYLGIGEPDPPLPALHVLDWPLKRQWQTPSSPWAGMPLDVRTASMNEPIELEWRGELLAVALVGYALDEHAAPCQLSFGKPRS